MPRPADASTCVVGGLLRRCRLCSDSHARPYDREALRATRPRVRDARPEGRDAGAPWGWARPWPGAVGHSRIVPYRARSPARSAAEGHAQNRSAKCEVRSAERVNGAAGGGYCIVALRRGVTRWRRRHATKRHRARTSQLGHPRPGGSPSRCGLECRLRGRRREAAPGRRQPESARASFPCPGPALPDAGGRW